MSWSKWLGGPRGRAPGRHRVPTTRRAFLGGAAAAITLPNLVSLPAMAGSGTGSCPVRLLYWYAPCGMVMDAWRPSTDGENYTMPRILAPLEPHREELLVLSNLANMAASVPVAGDHARGTGSFLSAMECKLTDGADIENGISIDQLAAQSQAEETLFRSLELGTTGGSSIGGCDSGYSCAYSRNISWANENTPMAKLTDAGLAFDRLFAGFDSQATEEDVARRKRWRTSVLDHAVRDINDLNPKLAASDRQKLDEYLTGVRDLEQRIQVDLDDTCNPGERPESGLGYEELVRAMTDITVLAMQCDLTRVSTFMLENGGSYRSFDFLGITGGHHELSHHQSDSGSIESLTQINEWEMAEFAYLLERMKSVTEADGSTLLDNSLVFLSSEISDGDRHNHDDLPVLLAGKGGGSVRSGRHISLPDPTPVANLYLTMLESFGTPTASFGQDGTTPLDLS